MDRPYVAVVGAGDDEDGTNALAEAVGAALATAGAVVVCGGLGGVMKAACRGALAAGGVTIGILPDTDRRRANPYLTVAVATGLGEARNTVVVRAADVVIAVGGEYGTLSEIGFALKIGRPVIGVGTWDIRGVTAVASADDAVTAALAAVRSG